MPYATLTGLTEAYGEDEMIRLSDRASPATGAVVVSVIDAALDDAGAMIDGYLAARYTLPLSETPPLIQALAQTIAFYRLHRFGAPDTVRRDYDDALKMLRDISTGTVRIPELAGSEPDGTGGSGARVTDRERPMTADNLKGFI